jgi:lipopolysaccharide/colanic/teichoic acid biosynthesis glycosyltransferase
MLYSAYKIKKESPEGPIIFKQKRVGLNGKEFTCYKFRSMVPDAEKGNPQFASEDDPRIFKWGAFMRKTRIDELPQIWNVLKGDMHMIGPRPERKYWVNKFKQTIPFYDTRHLVRPGITGWAQVNYPYGANEEDAYQKLLYDLYYIKNWNLWLEIKTIFKTVWVMVGRKGL